MKTRLPKALLAALLAAVCAAPAAYAVVTPDTVVKDTTAFLDATGSNIAVDGSATVTEDVTKNNVYVRDGELKITTGDGSAKPTMKVGSIVVSGNNAVLTVDNANYKDSGGSLNHVGGVDGKGTINVVNGASFQSESELFTIGVQGDSVGNGTTGTGYTNGSYDDDNFGRGDVNITDSTAKLTSRHLQMGEGSLVVNNSSVVIGNSEGASEFYKGFKATMGMGEGVTSTIQVSNGGSVEIYASKNANVLGGFSTNYSDGSTSNIIVDGGSFSVSNPANADSDNYPEGRNGSAYIGFSFMADADEAAIPKNATTNIVVSNGGKIEFDNHTTEIGHEDMAAAGSQVNVTVADSSSELSISAHDVSIHDGATLNNSGTVSIDTNYVTNIMADGNPYVAENTMKLLGCEVNNYSSGKIAVVNDLEVKADTQVRNEGSISAEALTVSDTAAVTNAAGATLQATDGDVVVSGSASLTNEGNIQADYFQVKGNAEVTNVGTVEGITWLQGEATLTLAEGSELDTVFVSGTSSLNVEGAVTLNGKLAQYYAEDGAQIVFAEGSSLDMQGNSITLGDVKLVFNVDGTVDSADDISVSSFIMNLGDASDIGEDTVVMVQGSEGGRVETTLGALNVIVPEPATATLSLLALAALAARRRRK